MPSVDWVTVLDENRTLGYRSTVILKSGVTFTGNVVSDRRTLTGGTLRLERFEGTASITTTVDVAEIAAVSARNIA